MTDYTDPDTWWDHYESSYRGRTPDDVRFARQLGLLTAHGLRSPLLDVGCGLGFLVEHARRQGLVATGLEASPLALERGRALHPHADLRAWSSGQPLPFPDAAVGGAALVEFVDHIPRPHNEALFAELRRVLRPGGLLLVLSPSRFNRFDDDLGHVDFFSPTELRAFVGRYGFACLDQPYTPQPLLGQGRLARRAMGALSRVVRPERWAARVDLVARKAVPA